MRRPVALLLMGAILLSACSIHTGNTVERSSEEDAYRQAWLDGAAAMDAAAPAMDACDLSTGDAQECVKADEAMKVVVDDFLTSLDGVEVPPAYQEGDEAWKASLRQTSAALELRDQSIKSKDNGGLRQALQDLSAVHPDEAVALYPDDAEFSIDMSN
jgi:hypothetical protein